MFCPQCGTESSSGQQYCRACGANLKVIGKALSLSEAIARTDRGVLPKIKELMKNLPTEQVSDEISNALDHLRQEMVKNTGSFELTKQSHRKRESTPAERREKHITHGLISFFSGIGLTIFLYFLSAALVLKLPPEIIAQAPFEISPVVRIIWLVGLIPMLTGLGRILAGLTIRSRPRPSVETPRESPETDDLPPWHEPVSVTERTTNILNRNRQENR
jgi:hypothetical protein